jgi:hypothetical protein
MEMSMKSEMRIEYAIILNFAQLSQKNRAAGGKVL